MLVKKFKLSIIFIFLMVAVLTNSLSAACGTCNVAARDKKASFMLIEEQIKILENINPTVKPHVEIGARRIQNILCEMAKIKFSEAGQKFARLSTGYFKKTQANIGKPNTGSAFHPCLITYPMAIHYFGKLYQTELNETNPFKKTIWLHIARLIKFGKNAINKLPSSSFPANEEEFSTLQTEAYKKAISSLKIIVKFVYALDNLSEQQQNQIDKIVKRCQFNFSQKEYNEFNKNFLQVETSLLRIKGIISAENC